MNRRKMRIVLLLILAAFGMITFHKSTARAKVAVHVVGEYSERSST